MGWIESALRRRSTVFVMAVAPAAALASVDGSHIATLPVAPGPRGDRTAEQAEIEREPVCVGSSVKSAGNLSDVLYYRAVALPDGRVEVGYFAFYSEERPWGNNWLTWSVVPALAVDLVYSRALLVAPGLQRALYGAGDVEGVGVVYDRLADGTLHFDHALADDGTHDSVALSREQVFALDHNRPTFYSEVWSHQLGGHRAHARSDLSYERCYGEGFDPPPPRVGSSCVPRRRRRPRPARSCGAHGRPAHRLRGGAQRARGAHLARRAARGAWREPQRPSASARLTMRGVMKMTSSPRASLARRRWKRTPRIGMSPKNGTWSRLRPVLRV